MPEAGLVQPTAFTVPPGVVAALTNMLSTPSVGLGAADQALPFQLRLKVCGSVAPEGVA